MSKNNRKKKLQNISKWNYIPNIIKNALLKVTHSEIDITKIETEPFVRLSRTFKIVNSYNIMFAINSEATQYKNAKWYIIYKEQANSINSEILLNYNEGNLFNQQKDNHIKYI